jgi:protocatechuate 3,4-dioxygenase beta subunit
MGIALLINLTIQNKSTGCEPMAGAVVDIWHCDKDGNYSEYSSNRMQRSDFTQEHFLRGRQIADEKGRVSFLSIYPGWYRGRGHICISKFFNSEGSSLLVTQVAFPEDISRQVYDSQLYVDRGQADTTNRHDNVFADSLNDQLSTVVGNVRDGFTLTKTIIVKG